MRRLHDDSHTELSAVLDELLASDIDITVREVARRHPTLHNASAFTRNPKRLVLIQHAQQRQADARRIATTPYVERATTLSEQVKRRSEEVARLESQVKALVASHVACVHAVMLAGGVNALERFWTKYKSIGDAVREVNAVPNTACVVSLHTKQKRQ